MADCEDEAWIKERIAATKALILVYEQALTVLGTGAQNYTLDTGQTRQTVTKADLEQVRATLKGLYTLLADLQEQLGCGGVTRVIPAW